MTAHSRRPAKRTLMVLLGWLLLYPSLGVAEVESKTEVALRLAAKSKTIKRVNTTTKVKRKKTGKKKVIKNKTVKKKSVRRSKSPSRFPLILALDPPYTNLSVQLTARDNTTQD